MSEHLFDLFRLELLADLAPEYLIIGLSWTFLTIFFEFASGLAGGITVRELVAAYNPVTGNLWLLVLATTMLSPMTVRKITRDKQ